MNCTNHGEKRRLGCASIAYQQENNAINQLALEGY
jgi:hypothetical protein